MSRDLTALNPGGLLLGTPEAVRRVIETALPGVRFYREPSGAEKLTAAAARGVEFPAALREHFRAMPATLQEDYEGNKCSIRFLLGTVGQAKETTVGSSAAGPAISSTCWNAWSMPPVGPSTVRTCSSSRELAIRPTSARAGPCARSRAGSE